MAAKRILALVAAVAMMLGLMVLPASAGAGVGVFNGVASVGQTAGACSKAGPNTNPSGAGLGLPGPNQNINGFWRLVAVDALVLVQSNMPNTVTDGGLDVCGKLTDVAGVGAACGMSKGYAGVGHIFSDNANTTPIIGLNDVGWKVSAGGTLPVIGRTNTAGNKAAKVGTLISIVQAQGGAACANPGGSNSFVVTGVAVVVPAELSWNDITDPVDAKDDNGPLPIWGPKK